MMSPSQVKANPVLTNRRGTNRLLLNFITANDLKVTGYDKRIHCAVLYIVDMSNTLSNRNIWSFWSTYPLGVVMRLEGRNSDIYEPCS